MHRIGEGAQQGKNLHHRRGLRRQIGQIDRGRKLRRGRQVQRERDVLRNVAACVAERVLAQEEAHRVACVARLRGGGQLLVHLIAHLLPDGVGVGQPRVVAAGVQRGGQREQRLAGLQREGRAARLRLRNARHRRRVHGLRLRRAGR